MSCSAIAGVCHSIWVTCIEILDVNYTIVKKVMFSSQDTLVTRGANEVKQSRNLTFLTVKKA